MRFRGFLLWLLASLMSPLGCAHPDVPTTSKVALLVHGSGVASKGFQVVETNGRRTLGIDDVEVRPRFHAQQGQARNGHQWIFAKPGGAVATVRRYAIRVGGPWRLLDIRRVNLGSILAFSVSPREKWMVVESAEPGKDTAHFSRIRLDAARSANLVAEPLPKAADLHPSANPVGLAIDDHGQAFLWFGGGCASILNGHLTFLPYAEVVTLTSGNFGVTINEDRGDGEAELTLRDLRTGAAKPKLATRGRIATNDSDVFADDAGLYVGIQFSTDPKSSFEGHRHQVFVWRLTDGQLVLQWAGGYAVNEVYGVLDR